MEEEIRLGNRERGWNDPPSMTYSPQVQNPPRRNLLNQRVAMPQDYPSPSASGKRSSPAGLPSPISAHSTPPPPPPSNNHTSPTGPPPSQAPPPSQCPPPCQGPPPSQGSVSSRGPSRAIRNSSSPGRPSVGEDQGTSGSQDVEAVSCDATLAKLNDVLEQCQKCLQKRVVSDIERRLKILQDSWKNDKLSLPVQKRTSQLASDLQARAYDSAHEVHLSLMLDHVSEVSQWMVGVKRLIHEARTFLPCQDETQEGETTNNEDGPGTIAQDQDPSLADAPTAIKGDAASSETGPKQEDNDSKNEAKSAQTAEDSSTASGVENIDINKS